MKKPSFMQHYWYWMYVDGDWYISRTLQGNFTFDLVNIESGNCFVNYEDCAAHPEVRDRLSKHIAKEPTL